MSSVEVRQTSAWVAEVLLSSSAERIVQAGFDGAHGAWGEGTCLGLDLVLPQRPDLVAQHGTHQRVPEPRVTTDGMSGLWLVVIRTAKTDDRFRLRLLLLTTR